MKLVTAARHLASIALLPFVVVVVVPRWALTALGRFDQQWQSAVANTAGRATGILLFTTGLLLFAWCAGLFARVGQGTLAPWDPTRRLVATGPYTYVRNPMITAVTAMLIGEALFFRSCILAGWSVLFVLINHVYFILLEEPGLERRFGQAYVEYRNQVPRWIPRLRSWFDPRSHAS